jgi:hypothetical protein
MAKLARSVSLALSILVVPLVAEADRDRGSGGGGRLGQVSSGMGRAVGGGSSGGGGVSSGGSSRQDSWYVHVERDRYEHYAPEPGVVVGIADPAAPAPPARPRSVSVDFFLGAQKVHESDGSLSLDLAFNEGRFRIGGSISRYFERQPGDSTLTFTMPALYLGWRIDDGGPTRVHIEAGAVAAESDNDPVMDSSIGGVLGGVRVEHRVSRRVTLVGDAQVMAFEHDVRAGAMRAGIRFGYLQATFRYLDLNVGPALYGPEVGIRF